MQDEGYIKFRCLHTVAALPCPVPLELQNLRNLLHKLGWIGVLPDGIGFGNVSMCGSNGFWITASQTGHLISPADEAYAWVFRADPLQNTVESIGMLPASSESMTHAACYLAHPEIQVVIHIHDHQIWVKQAGQWPETQESIAYGTPEMACAVTSAVREQGSIGLIRMAGHEDGLLFWGPSIKETLALLGVM